jgi:hypothetical protein
MKKISIFSKKGDCSNFLYISVLMITLIAAMAFSPRAAAQITGIAPTVTPTGGCAIDGDMLARIPTSPAPFTSSVGDMLENPSAPGTGGGIFTNPGGVSLDPAAFHIIDGYGGAPQSPNPDVDVFTQGSKFNQDPNSWHWTSGKPPQKDDMNNALFHVTEDAQGHSWFVGSGDRLAVNGTSYIDFELYQKRVTKNANGTFTSLGLDGGRTVGDLVITIDYSNGGSNAGAVVFRWEETSPGVFDYVLYTPPVGTIYAASNITGSVSVPFGAFGSTTYPKFSYAEVAANLNDVIPGLDDCIGIATVLIKTKSSDSDDAELKDFMEPVQVQLGTVPIVDITPSNPTLCNGQSTTLTANVTFPPNGPFTWAWTSNPAGFTSTDQSITVSPSATTDYIVVVTGPNGCQSAPDTATVTVNQPPTCSITGLDGPVCPSTSLDFTAPDGMDSYSWSITGNGSISGPDDEQTVTVIAGTDCGVSFVLNLDVSNDAGCSSTCSKEVTVDDNEAPTISGVGDAATIECPATPEFSDPSATDNCDDNPSLTFEDETTQGDCAQEYSVTRTWTATDACGNSSQASQTITVEDNTAPEITGVGDDATIECPATPEFSDPSATDLCDDNPSLNFEDETTQGDCAQEYSVTRTWTATDACGNSSQASQTITVEDNTAPEITGVGDDATIECPATPEFSDPSATDLCDDNPSLNFEDETTQGDCAQEYSVTRTWTATDACGNSSQASQTITVEDNTAPEITGVGNDATIECPATPEFSDPSATDLCDDNPSLNFEDETTQGDCAQEYSVTRTWTATDACGNSSTASQTITVEDNTAPEITGVGDDGTVECPSEPVFSDPSASDLCDDNPSLTYDDQRTDGNCAQEYSVTRTWTATDACGNSSTASQTITVEDNTAPSFSGVGPDTTFICPDEPVFSEPSVSDLCDADPSLTFETDSIPGDCPQSYTLIRTWTAVDACGNTSTASQTIIHLPNPHPEIILSDVDVIQSDTIFAECGEDVTIPFPEINTPCGPAEVFFTRSDGGAWEDPYETGTTDVCYWGISPCGFSTDTICFAVVVAECGQEFCSLTQGFYGNAGGLYCGGPTTTQLLNTLLASGPLVVGCGNNTMTYSSAQCIIDLLPGGGPSKKISGNNTCANHPGIQMKNGTIYNSLLAQTTTLGLNLRLSPTLGNLLIATNTLVSSPSPSCNADPGDLTFTFPALAVGLTVSQLYTLANNALGGCVNGVNLGSLTDALDAINRGFDKCRIGHFVTPLQASIAPPPDSKVENQDLSLVSLNSYPNPFNSIANITFSVPYSGHVKVDVYTLAGVKVQTLYDNSVDADEVYTVEFKGQPLINQATYICVISTELGTKYQRIMMVR